ncbi:MAG: FAD-dependent thymidylate synthase [Caldisericia bacterium]|nr:FAD-dependent thymidylate synthase [Caldisericia bacterium]
MSATTRLVLLTHTNEPQRICTAAARLSSLPGSPTQILDETPEGGYPDFIRRILSMGHHSIMEHANFTIAFENVSVFVEQFVIGFRLASFTVKSRRYVSHADAGYIVPQMSADEGSNLFGGDDKPYVGPEFYGPLSQRYLHYCEGLFLAYKKLVEIGISVEDARFVLPYSFKSNFIATGNARSWIHMIYCALHGKGKRYQEVNWIGVKLLEMLTKEAPALFSKIDTIENGSYQKEEQLAAIVAKQKLEKSFDHQKVEILEHTPDPDRVVAKTALVGASRAPSDEVDKILTKDMIADTVRIVDSSLHPREFEQAVFTFRLSGMSLPTLTHVTRHRMQGLIVPSFMEAGLSPNIVIPPAVEKKPEALAIFNSALTQQKSFWEAMDRFDVPPENRVYAYLSGQTIDVITTMNVRELLHFFQLRTCNRAQWEIRDYASEMLAQVKKVAPNCFKRAGASCFRDGKCREGRMTCGREREMKEYFGKL